MSVSIPLMVLATLVPGQALNAEYHYDFRGAKSLPPALKVSGSRADLALKPEAEGLRITVPVDPAKPGTAGFKTPFKVRGDFEITTSYDLVHIDPPTGGLGLGVQLAIITDTPTMEGLFLWRMVHPRHGEVYRCSRRTTLATGERLMPNEFKPAAGQSGQLRFQRTGAEVTVSAAEEGAADFQELFRYDLGVEDVTWIWVAAYPGRSGANMADIRISEFHIRAESLPGLSEPEAAASEPPQTRWRIWLALALVGLLAAGIGLGLRRGLRQRSDAAEAALAASPEPKAVISFICSGCGKNLKAREELAGKSLKCPHCGATARVSSDGRTSSGGDAL